MKRFVLAVALALAILGQARAEAPPVVIGLDAEFGLPNSTSAQAIEKGARIAMEEINRAGGVLNGRPLSLVTMDNRSVPARAQDNLEILANTPDLVAVLCGRFSPIVLETLEQAHARKLILLDPWASADGITDHAFTPSYSFRLSLRDSFAMPAIFAHARKRGITRLGLLLPNTGWGRSNSAAAQRAAAASGQVVTGQEWYNWGERSFAEQYGRLRRSGAQAVVLVGNDLEGAAFVREVAFLPGDQQLPIFSHWGVTGGTMVEQAGAALFTVDFSVVQTFSFRNAERNKLRRFMESHDRLYPPQMPENIASPVGVAHAYDLVHILALAINKAGTTDREAVRAALEKVRNYKGLVRDFPEPFTADRHDALNQGDVFMAVYRRDGGLEPLSRSTGR